MDKYDYIETIFCYIRGITGLNYQLQIKKVLKEYYQHFGKTFEMPDSYGGDRKNDGWVVEDAIFYQIYAPTRINKSLKKDIEKKFQEDLSGLTKHVYEKGEWKGKIEEFIFIVNTFDNNLPQDSERYFDNCAIVIQNKYNTKFKCKLVNSEYIKELLYDINNVDTLEKISASLYIRGMIDLNAITETMIMQLIMEISGNLNEKLMKVEENTTYNRISSINKIRINELDSKKEEIENIITKLDVVEKTVNLINQDITSENKFERVKKFIVDKYEKLAKECSGTKLYERLISEVISCSNNKNMSEVPTKFLIVYIFDKCDIFEKE